MSERLKKRRDFVLAAKGRRSARRDFLLESHVRGDLGPARFGFTVSKKVARKAVERNRIRRRLRELVRILPADAACNGHDYVLVGRRGALTASFAALRTDLDGVLVEAHRPGPRGGRPAARSTSR